MASVSPATNASLSGVNTTIQDPSTADLSKEDVSKAGGLRRLASIAAMSLVLTNSEPAKAQEGVAIAPAGPQSTYIVIRGADGVDRAYPVLNPAPAQGMMVAPQAAGAPVIGATTAAPQAVVSTNAPVQPAPVMTAPPAPSALPNILTPGAPSYQAPPTVFQPQQQGGVYVDPIRQRMVEAQIAERQRRYNDQMAIRAQREAERLQRMEEQRVRQFHRERSERVGWVLDWILPEPRR